MHSNYKRLNSSKKVWLKISRFGHTPESFWQFLDFKNHEDFFQIPPAIWNPQTNNRMTNTLCYGKNETEYSESCQMQNKQTDRTISSSLSIMVIWVWVSTSVQKSSDRTDFQIDNIYLNGMLEEASCSAGKLKPLIPHHSSW